MNLCEPVVPLPAEEPPMGESPVVEPPVGVFLDPTPTLLDYLARLIPAGSQGAFVDIGAGVGWLSLRLSERLPPHIGILALENRPHDDACYETLDIDGAAFGYVPGFVPILARPCHGDFPERVIRSAVRGAGFCLYIGLERNVHRDLGFAVEVGFTVHPVAPLWGVAGTSGESVWLVGNDERKEFQFVMAIDDKATSETGEESSVGIVEGRPEPKRPEARLCFIAPNGDYFPCAYTAHAHLAERLVTGYLPPRPGGLSYPRPMETLDNAGWVRLMGQGIFRSEKSWTPAQQSTAKDVALAFEKAVAAGVDLNRTLMLNPEDYYLNGFLFGVTSAPWPDDVNLECRNDLIARRVDEGEDEDALDDEGDPERPLTLFPVKTPLDEMWETIAYESGDADVRQAAPRAAQDTGVTYNWRYRPDGTPDGD